MPREDGYKNLIVPSSVVARANGSKGGKSKAKNEKAKQLFRAAIQEALKAPTEGKGTVVEEIVAAQVKKALEGDTKAFEVLRDTIGEKPSNKIETSVTNENKELIKKYLDSIKKNEAE